MPSESPSIVVFAQVPPPEHGQSRMVKLMLDGLREETPELEVHHVNARFSDTMEDIGGTNWTKFARLGDFITRALYLWMRHRPRVLYYVPGPVRWSAVLRDWLVLGCLRPFYHQVAFHWHAIGHGEWAHGSDRLKLPGPKWLDRIARRISARVLESPALSIVLTPHSTKDAEVIDSKSSELIYNGIEDPCEATAEKIAAEREVRTRELVGESSPRFRALYMSVGTVEKGLFDMLDAVGLFLAAAPQTWEMDLTIAGGILPACRTSFDERLQSLERNFPQRLTVTQRGYVTGAEKIDCLASHDLFIAASRWESFGLTVAEAMASGLAVVAAASDGVQGVLPERYPFLAPVADAPALSDALRRCCDALLAGDGMEIHRELRGTFLSRYGRKDFCRSITSTLESLAEGPGHVRKAPSKLTVQVYLADQNPKLGRSLGISRMTEVLLKELADRGDLWLKGITSRSSVQMPAGTETLMVPWTTRGKFSRVVTDHLHPLWQQDHPPGVFYFPKGFLPRLHAMATPSAVTIHDTIIQYYADHYPEWRTEMEYRYWANMLKHTLRHADGILTISEAAREQILGFMERHGIPAKPVTVTYEPCTYEGVPQPVAPEKENYVLHLGSREPHKRTAWLIRQWAEASRTRTDLPKLHVVGRMPEEVVELAKTCPQVERLPFLDDAELQQQFERARALIFPSEIEGFGLPAVEAYFLGTPVCFTLGTSIEEVLGDAASRGGIRLDEPASLFSALDEVLALPPEQVRAWGLALRERYSARVVADHMVTVFHELARTHRRS
ncbi:glycosyltransferase [Luteolibacter flavescens]|uniref:Glycosyltransferase n=1 Tax=Luteolibacter flavescens TaxID=1859460 RepID=A0ABT3FNL1_9BACT|nr:glycosyltransferase [Luteolibacter flavescens]MCW1885152.1 glycosyltransferase [Luteolibacter flavescens]